MDQKENNIEISVFYHCMNFWLRKELLLIRIHNIFPISLNGKRFLQTMKLDTPEFRALFTPQLTILSQLFAKNKFEIRMAGGAVRDLLMGIKPADVDFATDATPTQMKELFEREQIRMLHKKGEEHGTITCRINETENFEITTLRIDVLCDGRRAEVKYTTDWKVDAFRRDLTVNSLFLGLDGTVYDYTGGIEDIKKRRIAFVGDPSQRIQEDYLRILRYFRFFGRLATIESIHESVNIDAITKYRDGLKNISGERIWTELRKILVGRLASPIIRCMLERCGLGPYLALPGSTEDRLEEALKEFHRVATANSSSVDSPLELEPSTILSSLFFSRTEAELLQKRCKCSNAERELVEFIIDHREAAKTNLKNINYFKFLVLDNIFANGQECKELSLQKCQELLKYIEAGQEIRKSIEDWEIPSFPINGIDLMEAKVERGPKMRATLTYLFELWKKSDLQSKKEDLLKHITDPEIDDITTIKQKRRRIYSKSPPQTNSK